MAFARSRLTLDLATAGKTSNPFACTSSVRSSQLFLSQAAQVTTAPATRVKKRRTIANPKQPRGLGQLRALELERLARPAPALAQRGSDMLSDECRAKAKTAAEGLQLHATPQHFVSSAALRQARILQIQPKNYLH